MFLKFDTNLTDLTKFTKIETWKFVCYGGRLNTNFNPASCSPCPTAWCIYDAWEENPLTYYAQVITIIWDPSTSGSHISNHAPLSVWLYIRGSCYMMQDVALDIGPGMFQLSRSLDRPASIIFILICSWGACQQSRMIYAFPRTRFMVTIHDFSIRTSVQS